MSDYFVDYSKMQVLRKMATKTPNSQLAFIIKTLDETWDEEIQKITTAKKARFVTKF